MLSATTRLAIAVVATLMLLGGLGAILIGGTFAASGLWAVVVGSVALVALAIERNRYRSEDAERRSSQPDRVAASPTTTSTRASAEPPRRSWIRRPAPRCASSRMAGPVSGATSPRADPAARNRNRRMLFSPARRRPPAGLEPGVRPSHR